MTSTTALTGKLDELLGAGVSGMLDALFGQMETAEGQIDLAIGRHPESADALYHSFCLLTPTHDRMRTDFVYRSHCAELLDRVAAGQDTRPGTAAEVCIACCEASLVAPLTDTAAGLYARLWLEAFPGKAGVWADSAPHYEALRGSLIDDAEREMRRKLAVPDRTLKDKECCGMHHGEPVTCKFARPAEPAQLEMFTAA